MRDRLIGLLNAKSCALMPCDGDCSECKNSITSIADYLLANGVIVPPVKVGQTVYQINPTPYGGEIYELEVLDVSLHKSKPYYETESIDFDTDAIGKSVFLSREAAEHALKGGAE
jgi:hypothetical protein